MIQLSEHFSYIKLMRFTIPTIAMMIFTSIYGVVDGLFVSNIVGSESFAGVNLIIAGTYDARLCRIYGGNGRQCPCVKNDWRGQQKARQPLLFNAHLLFADCRHCAFNPRKCVYQTNFRTPRSKRRNGRYLLHIRQNSPLFIAVFYAAKLLSELSCSCRKTRNGTLCFRYCRSFKYGARLSVYICFPTWRIWRCACNSNQRICGCGYTAHLLYPQKQLAAKAHKNQARTKTDFAHLLERFV